MGLLILIYLKSFQVFTKKGGGEGVNSRTDR